ncbi:recombinase family protein [Thioalbus denitrificans]|uniref:DNA invertase Pin-like site-specific DNA recombinase n=1 Tax=Thioalbus denitrificans TaxID=547122 RepID=A0A369CDW4_9GAMM|nr:recombinase family protein [Thioalbus denitrificans]RCX32099.1 DNA invertase Pin-like site-specific DNA recombinase [Thioalbus denitrificans]
MKLLGYIRVSTEEQADRGRSLPIQDLGLHRYCDLYGHDLADVIVDDGVSAGIPLEKRPGGRELLERLRDGEAEGFVAIDLERVFRLTVDGLQVAAEFDRRGWVMAFVDDKVDTSDPDGMFILTIKLAACQRDRDKIRQRAVRIFRGLRDQSMAWGPTPYGCVRQGERLFRDPETWGVREEILRLREHSGLSLRAICTELQSRRIPAPSGGRLWHVSTLRGLIDSHPDLEHIPFLADDNETPVSTVRAVS